MFYRNATAKLLRFYLFMLTVMHVRAECSNEWVECSEFTETEKADCKPLTENLNKARNYKNETYYADAIEAIERGATADALRTALNSIIRGHTCYKYETCTWLALLELDEDPHNSNYVIGFYSRKYFEKINRDCGSKTLGAGIKYDDGDKLREKLRDGWNREHVFSGGKFKTDKDDTTYKNMCAYTDLHHLVVADGSVNSRRSFKDFKIGNETVLSGSKNDKIECKDCRETKYTFEPPDGQKGAVARMLLYMDVRYDGNDQDFTNFQGKWKATPNLTIVKGTTELYTRTMGDLCTLLEWNRKFPVTDAERKRNNGVQKWQGNRNPFIDNPRFAEKIWGGVDCPDEDINNGNEVANEDEDEDAVDEGSVGIVAAFVNPPGSSERTGEWVKIKNYGETAIPFKGYTLEDESARDPFPLSGILEPGAIACFNNFSKYIRLLNGGGSLTLKYKTKEGVIDSVQWNRVVDGEVVVFNENECDKDCRSPTPCKDEERETPVAEKAEL